jgi:hypothetical protein
VHTAPHPLGPWTSLGDVACVPSSSSSSSTPSDPSALSPATSKHQAFLTAIGGVGVEGVGATPTPGQGCQYVDPKTTSSLRSQQSDIFEVDLADGTKGWIWAGDRWQQSWDGTKAHDPQLWVPLVFETNGSIAPLRFLDNFTLPIV